VLSSFQYLLAHRRSLSHSPAARSDADRTSPTYHSGLFLSPHSTCQDCLLPISLRRVYSAVSDSARICEQALDQKGQEEDHSDLCIISCHWPDVLLTSSQPSRGSHRFGRGNQRQGAGTMATKPTSRDNRPTSPNPFRKPTRTRNPRSQSASVIYSAESSKLAPNSNNPYRQALSEKASSQSLFQDAEHAGERKNTQVQTIFNDLRTAHSSITSGSARSRSKPRRTSNNTSELHSDENSIQLQDLETSDAHDGPSLPLNLPLPPLPAAFSDGRLKVNKDPDQYIARDKAVTEQSPKSQPQIQQVSPAQGASFFASIRNALASISSPLTRDGRSELQIPATSHWPTDSAGVHGETRRSSLHVEKRNARQRSRTLSPREPHTIGQLGRSRTVTAATRYFTPHEDDSSIYDLAPSGVLPASSSGILGNVMEQKVTDHGAEFNDYYLALQDEVHAHDSESTPVIHDRSQGLPRQFSNGSSLPEGSTVGNIYRHYVRSDGIDDISEGGYSDADLRDRNGSIGPFSRRASIDGFPSSPPVKLSALKARKQQRLARSSSEVQRRPPAFTLPRPPPSTTVQHINSSISEALGQSSSYGDTKKLLEIPQPTTSAKNIPQISRPNDSAGLKSYHALSDFGDSSQPSLPRLNVNNPFKNGKEPQIIISSAESINAITTYEEPRPGFSLADRLPLEREVSKALRRASGCSAYSNGSVSTSAIGRYDDFVSETSTYKAIRSLIKKNETTAQPPLENTNEERRIVQAQAQAFYDQQAIPSTWITTQQHNVVRVPINHNGSFPDSPPDSPPAQIKIPHDNRRRSEDTNNDWETVGDSIPVARSEPGMMGGTVNRAGSSIANTSDAGTSSPYVPEIGDFSSTDRITQHPGNIQYSGDYRQRDLKKTHIPVFLPVFREHKVNGYLADSSRIRPPPNPFYSTPAPLKKPHINPFKSSPPKVTSNFRKIASSVTSATQRSRNGSRFPRLSVISQSSDGSKLEAQNMRTSNSARSSEWMDEFGEPGPMINPREDPFLKSGPGDRPTSWQHMMAYGRGDSVPGYNIDGSRRYVTNSGGHSNADSSRCLDSSVTQLQNKSQNDGFVETQTSAGRNLTNTRARKPMVKGPPGAFYQGLRSSSGREPHKGASWILRKKRSTRAQNALRSRAGEDYPTNELRPISLLTQRPVTPVDQITPDANTGLENDFIYRSPLAPPKRNTWMQLYNPTQLTKFREMAKANGIMSSQKSISAGLRNSIVGLSSQKHLFEAPRLSTWSRDDPVRTDLAERKSRISRFLLVLSAIFPPILVLYAFGFLDGVMLWWTDGECSGLGKRHKKIALFLMYMWGLAFFLGLVGFLVYWFAVHAHQSNP